MPTSITEYTAYDTARRGQHQSTAEKREDFEVDKARIIHSGSFRRLQGKTQVLGVGERDFYRTRLTHSLEVAQIGRGLCREIARPFDPNLDLVETICLAHDIGHSPFGHSGEHVLHHKLAAHFDDKVAKRKKENNPLESGDEATLRKGLGFGANPQNLRIVALLEAKYEKVGLDLTRATLDGLVKIHGVL